MKKNIDIMIKESAVKESVPQGHEERFLAKLKQQNAKSKAPRKQSVKLSKKRKLTIIMGAAAVILVMITFFRETKASLNPEPCDEVCEFLVYTDSSIQEMQTQILFTAANKLPEDELLELKKDLLSLTNDYESSKSQQDMMTEDAFIGFINNVYQQQKISLSNIVAVLN